MKTTLVCIVIGLFVFRPDVARAQSGEYAVLSREYSFAPGRAADTQYYIMHADMTMYAANGEQAGNLSRIMFVTAEPAGATPEDGYYYTCRKFALIDNGAPAVTIPALENWRYLSTASFVGVDDQQQIFGIDQGKFASLIDSYGVPIQPDMAYNIYDVFIDFHSIVSMYAEPVDGSAGIGDLTGIGQTVTLAASGIEAPLHFGDLFADGSHSRNGTMSLQFKGLSAMGDAACALIAYDTGEGSLTMIMSPAPDMTLENTGVFRNTGEIWRDLDSQCVLKAAEEGMVITEMFIPWSGETVHTIALRSTLIENVPQARFDSEMASWGNEATGISADGIPVEHALYANSPNPFNASTTISYNLAEPDDIRLEIFNISGQLVKTLVAGRAGAGVHTVVWDGAGDNGGTVASGVYVYRLSTPRTMLQQKMMLLK